VRDVGRKMAKKEERLSKRAREMIKTAKESFSHVPYKAIAYLQSVDPKEWNLYDRQKIGREILRRQRITNNYSGNIVEDYNLSVPKRTEGNKFFNMHYWKHTKRTFGGSQIHHPEESELRAKKEEDTNPGSAIYYYESAAEQYEKGGIIKEALNCYQQIVRLFPDYQTKVDSSNIPPNMGFHKHVIENMNKAEKKVIELESLKGRLSEMKARTSKSSLEGAVTTASILSFLGSIFFLQSNFTGNAISNLTQTNSNIFGSVLLIIAIVSGLIWLSRKKSKKIVFKKRK
jgi:tetratricopeptide (TPR) repeat protein